MSGPEFFFYHLERQTLEDVLPSLLEKTLQRGWRACLRFTTPERMDAVDSALWTYRADSFLPHGTARDGFAELQPIYLTTGGDAPNNPDCVFTLEQATEASPALYSRIVRVFDGLSDEQLALARQEWRDAKAAGWTVKYWKQNADRQWENKA